MPRRRKKYSRNNRNDLPPSYSQVCFYLILINLTFCENYLKLIIKILEINKRRMLTECKIFNKRRVK